MTWWLGQDVVVTTQPYSWADQDRLGAHPSSFLPKRVHSMPLLHGHKTLITSMALASSPCHGLSHSAVSVQPAYNFSAMTFLFTTSKRARTPSHAWCLDPPRALPMRRRCMQILSCTVLRRTDHAIRTPGGLPWPLNYTVYLLPLPYKHPFSTLQFFQLVNW